MKVADVMTRRVHTCRMDDPLEHAARLMWDHACGCVPVVDGEGRAVAMITDRDVCMAAYTQGRPLSDIKVSTAASRELFTAHESDYLQTVEALMERHRVRRLPVLDDGGRPVGIVSLDDLALHSHSSYGHVDALSAESIVRTLGAICRP